MSIKKIISISIIFLFLISTAAATTNVKKIGHDNGYKNGYSVGKNIGKSDCLKYGKSTVLRQIPNVVVFPMWSVVYQNGYKSGYVDGFVDGYHSTRLTCLRGV